MIVVKNISYQIDNKLLLNQIDLEFHAGKFNLIIGPNGAGKTTLLKVLCNQIQAQSGAIFFDGLDVKKIPIIQLAKMRAVLSQNIELAFPLKVSEVVMMGRYPHFNSMPEQKDKLACEESMQFFDISDLSGRNYMTLSGGEKQRVHFARVLAQLWYPNDSGYRYLILDEPLTFLDIHYQIEFMNKIKQLLKMPDLIVIGVIHDLNLCAKFGDYIVLMNKGKIISKGPKELVLNKENIKNVYQIEPMIYHENQNMHLLF